MSIELKIKSKHLAFEPAIIRHEEKKLLRQIKSKKNYQSNEDTVALENKRESLYHHRVWDVRNESRATLLARTFLAGKPYKSVERKVHDKSVLMAYIVPRILSMVLKYGPTKAHKVWNREKSTWEYPKDLLKEHTDIIKKWIEA